MKYYTVILLFVGISLVLSFSNTAHGIWIPESPHDLLENSATIFVGNITSTKVLQFEEQWSRLVSENGTNKTITENYMLNLDQYTVDVEEYLKNPQNSTKMIVSEPTIGIVDHRGGLDKFKTGDHVLFYIENLGGNNTYSPESFLIPTFCNAKDVITQQRINGGLEFNVTQNGISVDYDNFTAGKLIRFLYSKDMSTLFGRNLDISVGISKVEGQNYIPMFSKEIHSSSKLCNWIATAEWEFRPHVGKYEMYLATKEDNVDTGESYTGFSVRSDVLHTNQTFPLQQFYSGIPANEIKCKKDLQLIFKSEDNSPTCVKPHTAQILFERGWAK
jgi:hypothetical protein